MTSSTSPAPTARVALRYEVPRSRPDWTLPEEPVPESQTHDLTLDLLKSILLAWVERSGLNAQVARNLAVRWDEQRPAVGADPDLCLIVPATPEGDGLTSLCLWQPGHHAPRVAVEVVSESHPRKDYASAPDRYAACGVQELWVFDPHLAGPKAHGGPCRLQLWARDEQGEFVRAYAGEGPAYSPEVEGWLVAVSEGKRLRIAGDAEGSSWWMTAAERERAEKQRERAEKERERAEKQALLERVAQLEARLRQAGG